jgi:HPt (histidine-containing phosphotransfer) domain-containing protein
MDDNIASNTEQPIDVFSEARKTSTIQKEILDETILDDFAVAMGDRAHAAIIELIEAFLQDADTIVEDIKQAQSMMDWPAMRKQVHTLKGNCAVFGAASLARLCKETENALDQGELENISQRVNQIENDYAQLREILVSIK